jgi:hypothetical protein
MCVTCIMFYKLDEMQIPDELWEKIESFKTDKHDLVVWNKSIDNLHFNVHDTSEPVFYKCKINRVVYYIKGDLRMTMLVDGVIENRDVTASVTGKALQKQLKKKEDRIGRLYFVRCVEHTRPWGKHMDTRKTLLYNFRSDAGGAEFNIEVVQYCRCTPSGCLCDLCANNPHACEKCCSFL